MKEKEILWSSYLTKPLATPINKIAEKMVERHPKLDYGFGFLASPDLAIPLIGLSLAYAVVLPVQLAAELVEGSIRKIRASIVSEKTKETSFSQRLPGLNFISNLVYKVILGPGNRF